MAVPVLCSRCSRFESEGPPITCVALDGGPCSACKERTATRHQIKQLEEELAKLKAKHDTLTSTMNAIHDPFIHKFPPEIGSHIFRLSSPTLSNAEYLEAILNLEDLDNADSAKISLRLGGVCRMWRQLAWATPDLWGTLHLRFVCRRSLAKFLPDLVREWLERSGSLPLTIFWFDNNSADDRVAIGLIIEILSLHSRRWRILNLMTTAHTFRRFSSSIQPNQLVGLGLQLFHETSQLPNFMLKSELTPTHLSLDFPLTSVNVRWDNITHLTLCHRSTEECIDVLRRAPGLEYYSIFVHRPCTISFREFTLHLQLRSLHLTASDDVEDFFGAIKLPSLEELTWTQDDCGEQLPMAASLSLFERSGCRLKVLRLSILIHDSTDLLTLLQAMPSLERIHLSFYTELPVNAMMDGILARIFCLAPGSSDISVEDSTPQPFLPHLQFMECDTYNEYAPFSWDRIPLLCHQGHRRSLMLKIHVKDVDISDEIALQLLQLADEGLDLQINQNSSGHFLENFRKRMCKFSLSTTQRSTLIR